MDWVGPRRPSLVTGRSQWPGWAAGTRALHSAKVINYLRTVLQHLHLKQRRMVLPGEDEDEDEGIDPSVGRRIFSSFSSFKSLPLCSCVSVCWFFLLTLWSPLISSSDRFLCFFPCFLLLFSLLFFLATHWPFIEAEPTGCSPVRLFFPWQRISPAGTWIWDSILISPGVYLHVGILFKPRVLGRLGHQQSRSCWTVSGGFFPFSKTC